MLRLIAIGARVKFSKLEDLAHAPKSAGSVTYNITDDFEKIVISGRVWGQTEGAVYGLPTHQWWRGWVSRFDMPTRDPGVLVFVDDAATLFKPHPIQGPYSFVKSIFGQRKADFGDIIIE